jgi:hypothetical protein
MNSRRLLYPGLLIAALMVAACGPEARPEPAAAPTMPMPTDTPTRMPIDTPTPMSSTDTPAPTATAEVPPPTLSEAEGLATSEGEVPMGFTEDGAPYRGNPNAPVTLVEHSEFQ